MERMGEKISTKKKKKQIYDLHYRSHGVRRKKKRTGIRNITNVYRTQIRDTILVQHHHFISSAPLTKRYWLFVYCFLVHVFFCFLVSGQLKNVHDDTRYDQPLLGHFLVSSSTRTLYEHVIRISTKKNPPPFSLSLLLIGQKTISERQCNNKYH